LVKSLDKASPILFVEAAAGAAHDRVILRVTQPGSDGKEIIYYELVLDDVFVSSYSVSSGGERPTESVALNFARIEVSYSAIRPDGTLDKITRNFDFAQQQER
jgi:type VI secretion system secreted protein Hcp